MMTRLGRVRKISDENVASVEQRCIMNIKAYVYQW